MKLFKLQDNNKEIKKLRLKKLLEGKKDIEKVFHDQDFLYILKVIYFELINRYHNNPPTIYF